MQQVITKISSKKGRKKENLLTREQAVIQQAIENPLSSMKALILEDFYMFLQYFWDQYSTDKLILNWHMDVMTKELMKIARRVAAHKPKKHDTIFNVPPGSTKTAICSIFFPLWCWCNWYWMRFITASFTAPLALESAEYSRDVIRSEKFRAMFPEIDIKQDKDSKSNFRVVKYNYHTPGQVPRIMHGGGRISTSVTGSATGFHCHIFIWDDLIDPLKAISETEIKKANHFVDNVIPFRKVSKKVTATIGIMQRLAEDDPTGHLLKEKKGKINHICIPGEIKNYRDFVKPKKLIKFYKNNLMDPKRLGWKELKAIERKGQYTYGGQIGQNPVPLGGGMFKTEMIATIDHLPHELLIEYTVRCWDKAGSEGTGAYSAGVKMCKTNDGKYIIIDIKRGQWGTGKRENVIKATAEADGPNVDIGVEQEPGSGGKESAENTVTNLAGYNVKAKTASGDKAIRADPFSVQVEWGNVQMLRGGWNEDFINELKFFPNSTYKDQVDASSEAFTKLTSKKQVKIGLGNKRN
jgi:predicted phage terminase large subunit-like protein